MKKQIMEKQLNKVGLSTKKNSIANLVIKKLSELTYNGSLLLFTNREAWEDFKERRTGRDSFFWEYKDRYRKDGIKSPITEINKAFGRGKFETIAIYFNNQKCGWIIIKK